MDLVVFPPEHGRSATDFWGWDAHEAQLCCPDDVSGDIGGCSARRALKPKCYQPTQTMVTVGILPFRENSHGRTGNRTRDLMISRQRLWPLDHEAGQNANLTLFQKRERERGFGQYLAKRPDLSLQYPVHPHTVHFWTHQKSGKNSNKTNEFGPELSSSLALSKIQRLKYTEL